MPDYALRFNPAKLLIDPHAKAIEGDIATAHRETTGAHEARGDVFVEARSVAVPRRAGPVARGAG